MSGSCCYAHFIYEQIELNLRSAVELSGESATEFKTVKRDLSDQDFTQYYFDLSAFSFLTTYDRIEEEQWVLEGHSFAELNYLRETYVFGERWSAEDKNGREYDRGFTVSVIISLSIQLSGKFVQFAEEANIPLHTVISIFYGLLDKEHNAMELMVRDNDSSIVGQGIVTSVAIKIHDTFLEYLSMISLSITIEFLWCVAALKEKKDKKIIKSFLRRHCFYVCCDEQILQLDDSSLIQYLQDRYFCVKESFYAFCNFFVEKVNSDARHIHFLTTKNSSVSSQPEDFCIEEYEFRGDVAQKIYKKMFVYKYCLQGNSNNIIAYFSKIILNIRRNNIRKNNSLNSDLPVSPSTLQRYKNQYKPDLTLEEIDNISTQKQKTSIALKDGYLSQNKLVDEVLLGWDRVKMNDWAKHFKRKNIDLVKLSRRGYMDRLKRLEEEGIITPDFVEPRGKRKYKYYRDTPTNMNKIAIAISTLKRKKPQA